MSTRQKILVFFVAMILAFNAPLRSRATTFYVKTNGSDSADGTSSWDTAYLTISKGITMANNKDVILVSNGVYSGVFTVNKGVTVQAASTNPSDTILLGNNAGCLTLNHADALVSGFTVSSGMYWRAGGVWLGADGGTLSNCLITRNTANWGSAGGGVTIYAGLVVGCTISDNLCTNAQDVGGIYMSGGEVRDCLISNNISSNCASGTVWGGGVNMTKGRLVRCIVANNKVDNNTGLMGWGAGIRMNGTDVTVSQCVIRANSAKTSVGGILQQGVLSDSTVENNVARQDHSGGIYACGQINNCQIRGNTAASSGGGINIPAGVSPVIRNCLVYNNVAGTLGGGVRLDESAAAVTGYVDACTIVSNQAGTYGGGVYNRRTNCLYNTIIASNTALTGGADFYNVAPATTNFYYNCCVPTLTLPPAKGNIKIDPGFADFNGANFRLVKISPCINKGINRDWMTNSSDLDNRTRIRYGAVDMGAYELIYDATIYRAW